MKRFPLLAALAFGVLLLTLSPASQSATLTFSANLLPSNEVPPVASAASGTASFVLNTTAQTLSINETFTGLTSGTTANHIHCCLVSPFLAGVNAGVATTLPAFTGFPTGITSGTFSITLDLTSAGSYNPAFVTAQGSLANAEAALIAGIENGESYINIHTTNNPNGEIRGFLTPTPEPASLVLLGSALAGLIGLRLRKL